MSTSSKILSIHNSFFLRVFFFSSTAQTGVSPGLPCDLQKQRLGPICIAAPYAHSPNVHRHHQTASIASGGILLMGHHQSRVSGGQQSCYFFYLIFILCLLFGSSRSGISSSRILWLTFWSPGFSVNRHHRCIMSLGFSVQTFVSDS